LPKATPEEKAARSEALENASIYATEIPLRTIQVAAKSIEILEFMVKNGNPNSVTDAAVGLLCVRTALKGAYYNVMVNAKGLSTKDKARLLADEAKRVLAKANEHIDAVLKDVESGLEF